MPEIPTNPDDGVKEPGVEFLCRCQDRVPWTEESESPLNSNGSNTNTVQRATVSAHPLASSLQQHYTPRSCRRHPCVPGRPQLPGAVLLVNFSLTVHLSLHLLRVLPRHLPPLGWTLRANMRLIVPVVGYSLIDIAGPLIFVSAVFQCLRSHSFKLKLSTDPRTFNYHVERPTSLDSIRDRRRVPSVPRGECVGTSVSAG
jgi:hypothetical protein